MNSVTGLRFLRPSLHNGLSSVRKAAYLRFFSTSQYLLGKGNAPRKIRNLNAAGQSLAKGVEFRSSVKERIDELKAANALQWPRIKSDKAAMTVTEYLEKYRTLTLGQYKEEEYVKVRGRIRALRISGSGLVFLDIMQDGKAVQIVCNRKKLEGFGSVTRNLFVEFYHIIRRGDIICELPLSHRTVFVLIDYSCLWESVFHQHWRTVCQCCRASGDSLAVFGQSTKGAG